MKITYKRKYFFGGNTRSYNGSAEDYITAYVASNGKYISVIYTSNTMKHYDVDGKYFETLSEAKSYCETH